MTTTPPAPAGGSPWYRRLITAATDAFGRAVLGRDPTGQLVADRERLSTELTRRLGELYSLQELAHVLSASLRFDRVVVEVARYAMRALDASGAVVLLAPEHGGSFEVVAAKGVLAPHLGRRIDPDAGGLLVDAIGHERVELRPAGPEAVLLFENAAARTAVAAPLRAHGVTVGAILVADKLVGDFTADDARLLSTAATHAAVVLTNARYFELVRVGKEQWEGTFDALAEGLAMLDAAGLVRRANTAMAQLMRVPIVGVVGRSLGQALFGDAHMLEPQLAEAREGRRPAAIVRRSEVLGRYLRVAVSPLATPRADAAAVVVVEDITDQKALESQLIQSEKLATVGTLVSGVAHELNNPLTSVAGLSEFLLERGTGDETAREHLRVINDQAERASRIVRNLLSFARKSAAAEPTAVDLGEIVQRTVLLMGYELGRAGISVETALAPSLPPVAGNRDELQQVLLNLVTNAAYALGRLEGEVPRRLTVGVAEEGDRVVLRVTDTGPGIAPEALGQIFDPFFTTKPPGEGTGLGLFLAYGIAEAHGGTLTAESTPGQGATFALSLPRFSPVAAPPAAQSPVRHRVLVVDHDTAMRRLAAVFFAHEGYDVDEAKDGEEALALVHGADYALVLADRHAEAGAEPLVAALGRLKPEWHARLIVTGTGAPVAEGAARFLKKPFSPRDLRAAAAGVLASAS